MNDSQDRTGADCRARAANVIDAIQFQGLSLGDAVAKTHCRADELSFLKELCYGTCRYFPELDGILAQLLQKPFKAKDRILRSLLLVGAYQLLYTRVPDHAAINATVEAARLLDRAWAKGLVNGVLRRIQRAKASDTPAWSVTETMQYAHPEWLLKQLREAWPEHWQKIADENNTQAPMWLRVNRLLGNRETYLASLQEAGLGAVAGGFTKQSIRLLKPEAVDRLPGFHAGRVSVQDAAAQLAASLLRLEPGQRVLDACAAPGGKTCHILELEPDLKELVALEVDPTRIPRITENLQRLRLSARLICADAGEVSQWWDGLEFARILLDAPCSATGVIRRHPDIKLLRRRSDIDKLAELQLHLLKTLWQTLADGGILVYATCSVLPRENENTIARFLDAVGDAREIPIQGEWGEAKAHGRQLLPERDGQDGFYYARLQKTV